MSSSSLSRCVITNREGVSMPLLRKRTKSNKLRHKEILGAVPIEIVPAWDERMSMRYRGIDKRSDPIGNLLIKYEFSPELELVEAICRACAQKQFDATVWDTIRSRIEDLVDTLNAVDSGLIIKNVVMYTMEHPAELPKFSSVIVALLRKIGSRRLSAQAVGTYTLLYGMQTLSHFKDHIQPETVSRYFSLFLQRIVRGGRISSMHTTGLINTVQAIAHRPFFISISPLSVEPIIEELASRVSQPGHADTPERDPPDVDGLFGLVSAVAKLSFTKTPQAKRLFDSSQTLLFANDHQYLNLLTFAQLAGTVHAFSRFGPAALSGYTQVFRLVGDIVICEENSTQWTPRIFATVLNAYGTAAVCHEDLMDHLSLKKVVFDSLEPMQTAMCVYGLSKLGRVEKFPQILNKVSEQLVEMNLHSLAKVITSLQAHPNAEPIVDSIFSRVAEMIKNEGISDTESLIVILQAAVDIGQVAHRNFISNSLHCLESNISKIGCFSKVSKLVHDACILLPADETLLTFSGSLIHRIHTVRPAMRLADFARMVYGVSVLGEVPEEVKDEILSILKHRAAEIPTLSYRPLSRLTTAIARLGISDIDLEDVMKKNS